MPPFVTYITANSYSYKGKQGVYTPHKALILGGILLSVYPKISASGNWMQKGMRNRKGDYHERKNLINT